MKSQQSLIHHVSGQVLDAVRHIGIRGVRIEAYGIDSASSEVADCAISSVDGRFEIALQDAQVRLMLPDGRAPMLYFRVFDGNRLLADTRDTVTWRLNGQPTQVQIVIDTDSLPEDTADPARLVVRGLVADAVAGPLGGVTVEALDRVLERGQLRDVRVGGARTDAQGRYRIEYAPAAGKLKADLTVRALETNGDVQAASALVCHAPTTSTVDLFVGDAPWTGPAERDRLADLVDDIDVADVSDEVAEFVQCSRQVPEAQFERLRASARLARDYRISAELLYALGSAGLSVNLRAMLAAEPGELKDSATRAIEANAVSRRLEKSLDDDLAELRRVVVGHNLKPTTEANTLSLGDLLATGTTDADVHQAFLDRFTSRTGTIEEFWAELATHPPFTTPEVVEDLQLSLQLALLTQNVLPVLTQLGEPRRAGTVHRLADLTTLDRAAWQALLNEAGGGKPLPLPAHVTGDTYDERLARYLDGIIEPLKDAFPGRYLRQTIARPPEVDVPLVRLLRQANPDRDPRAPLPEEPDWGGIPEQDRQRARDAWTRLRAEIRAYPDLDYAGLLDPAKPAAFVNPIRAGVDRLLTNLADPNLGTTNLDTAIADSGDAAYDGIPAEHRDAVVRQAKRYQRVYRVAPRAEQVDALLGAGLHSAFAIATSSAKKFARDLGPALGGERAARQVFETATQYAGTAQLTLTAVRQSYLEVLPWAIGGDGPPAAGSQEEPAIIPDLAGLFGPLAFCECDHCRSVYSPAAYLVDLLAFVDTPSDSVPIDPPTGDRPIDALLSRRPDLANTLLTCENTNTPLPYIDLVNEILEAYVHQPDQPLPAYDVAGATAEELRAVPQYVDDVAYETVATSVYPMTLPFHRPLAVVRTYLDHLGVSRERLLETYRPGAKPWDEARVAESLGMSAHEYDVVTGQAGSPTLPACYGFGKFQPNWIALVAEAPEFLARTGIAFTDLADLVKTWFVNRNQASPSDRVTLDSPGECDLENTTITHLDDAVLSRAHRFLRLWRRVGWPMADLDRALFALGVTDLDPSALRRLAQLRQVIDTLRLTLPEALALLAPIDTWGRDAHYLRLFQNRAVAAPVEVEAFRLEYPNKPGPNTPGDPDIKNPDKPFGLAHDGQPLDEHVPVVLAGLRVTEPELDLIREHAGVPADAPVDLALLSTLYRYAVLARGVRLRIADLISLLRLTNLHPFAPQEPAGALDLLAVADRVRRTGMTIEVLDYLYRHALRPTLGPAPVPENIDELLTGIGDKLRQLRDDLVDKDDPSGEDLRAKLGSAFEPGIVAQAMGIVLVDPATMPADPAAFITANFAVFADPAQAVTELVHPAPADEQQRAEQQAHNIDWLTTQFMPWLRTTLAHGVVVTALAAPLGLAPPLLRDLLEHHLSARVAGAGHAMADFVALADGPPADGHRAGYELLHKAALLIDGLGLDDREVSHLVAHPNRFASFTVDGLPLSLVTDGATAAALFAPWSRAAELAGLRDELPGGERTLVDLFEAQVPANSDPVTHLLGVLAEVTGWDPVPTAELATGFGLTEEELRSEVALLVVRDCLDIALRAGVVVPTLFAFAAAAPDAARAKDVVQAVKARYDNDRWLEVAQGLNDGLREAGRTALVDYLVPRMRAQNVFDANDLFAYFLIDTGMQSCMVTSRIKQAISSVQLFVQRCLLNLEPEVAPEEIDADQWTWLKSNQLWEANRKVFLYAENWIYPEARLDKSPIFRQLESELLANELTDEYVEQVYLNYLRRLDEVARLDIRAMHWQTEGGTWFADPDIDQLHVFGRTLNPPYKYFYRRFEDRREWTPWEPVELDINDAPHLIALVHDRRLQLFWSTFTQQPYKQQTPPGTNDDPPPQLLTYEVGLNWSELRNGMWAPKQVSPVTTWPKNSGHIEAELDGPARFLWHVELEDDTVRLRMGFYLTSIPAGSPNDPQFDPDRYVSYLQPAAQFERDGTRGTMRTVSPTAGDAPVAVPEGAGNDGMSYEVSAKLWFKSPGMGTKKILDAIPYDPAGNSPMLHPAEDENLPAPRLYPFFLAHQQRAYFAYPVPATPDRLLLPGLPVASPGLHVQIEDDLFVPGPIGRPRMAGGDQPPGEKLPQDIPNLPFYEALSREHDLRFVTFWHPHVSGFIRTLNRDGIPGLLTRGIQQPPMLQLNLFENTYEPTGNVARPRPKTEVDFTPGTPYSLYNWELFFHVPMLIADRLRQDGRYAEARQWLHYIFDPTTDEQGETPRRFWKFYPFFTNTEYGRVQELLELLSYTGDDPDLLTRKEKVVEQVTVWKDHPFEPHRIALLRLVAYQKNVVMRYVDNLLEWGDSLFRRDTIESINEAAQYFVLAAKILGRRPERMPAKSTVAPKSYGQLRAEGLDEFSNAAVAMETILFPYAQTGSGNVSSGVESILGLGRTLYFCTPNNDQLLGYWDRVEDRMFKIRNCLNIEGVARQLALFDPPIDPAALVRAVAAGADLDSVLADLYAPLPKYRFTFLLPKAHELCAEVKALGAALLAALEKKDAEQLSSIRAVHEVALLTQVTQVRTQQVAEAYKAKQVLTEQQGLAELRRTHYDQLLDEKLTDQEQAQLDHLDGAQAKQEEATLAEIAVAHAGNMPSFTFGSSGSMASPVATTNLGRDNAVAVGQAISRQAAGEAGTRSYHANLAAIRAGHVRREQDWQLQFDVADREYDQLDKQLEGADLRIQIVEQELSNHETQLAHAREVEEFLRRKFGNEELYTWMVSQLSATYFQAYKLAYDVAKSVERAYRFERGLESSDFIQFGYWEGLRKGLLAGERLSLDLNRLESAWLEQNQREYELSRRVSLVLHDPAALIQLKATGQCEVELPESMFDADYPGHFFRRVKNVSLTIPCVTGPYTNVNCTLTLLANKVRFASSPSDYAEQKPEAVRQDFMTVSSIATSHGQNDTGLFELSFRDERYLPFEGAGAVSRWRIDLPVDSNAFDFDTISDVVVKVDYTAREGGALLRTAARSALAEALGATDGETGALSPPLRRLFSARHEFSTAWHRFQHPDSDEAPAELVLDLITEHYPYLLRGKTLHISRVELYVFPQDGALLPVPGQPVPVTLTLPDQSTNDLTLTPPGPGDPVPLARAATADGFTTDQATGALRLTVPAGALPVDDVHDLAVVFTYSATSS